VVDRESDGLESWLIVDRRTRRELLARLEGDAQRICLRFRLRYRVLEAERANVKRRYGVCFSDGTIRIRLRHATTGRPLKYSSLVNTLCHELAHLRHFNHGPRFQTFYGEILEWARREGIYRPGAPAATGGRIAVRSPASASASSPSGSGSFAGASAVRAAPEGAPGRRGTGRRRAPIPGQLELFG